MKRYATLPIIDGANLLVECPRGKKIRITSIVVAISPGGWEYTNISYVDGDSRVVAGIAAGVDTTTGSILCAIGMDTTLKSLNTIDPVTGLAVYDDLPLVTSPLPNVWWDKTILVTFVLTVGSFFTGVLSYEEDQLD